jgi:hypothetical protein
MRDSNPDILRVKRKLVNLFMQCKLLRRRGLGIDLASGRYSMDSRKSRVFRAFLKVLVRRTEMVMVPARSAGGRLLSGARSGYQITYRA